MSSHVTHESGHPQALDYVKVAAILAVVTGIEVAIYYIDALKELLVPILLALSAFKFAMVVLWFMHLRFDSKLFSIMFIGGLMLAGTVFLVLLSLFFFAGNLAGTGVPMTPGH